MTLTSYIALTHSRKYWNPVLAAYIGFDETPAQK